MFSRRHPYLFFLLMLSAVVAFATLGLGLLVIWGTSDSDLIAFDRSGEKVGVIEITGFIAEAGDILGNLKRFREEESIKAIVVRIDSPGGAVGPAQEIFREIGRTVQSKKVIASMGTVAASGGYYVAAAADGIVANPGTITGSIGVIMGYTNFQQILKKIGLVPVVFKSGEYKDMGSPVRDMSDEEKKILQEFVAKIHRQFVEDVAAGRKLEPEKIGKLADGRIYTGEEAKALGLVDRLGNLNDSIEWAGRLAGIEGKVTAVYAREKKLTFIKYLMETAVNGLLGRVFSSLPSAAYLYQPTVAPPP